jgi:hypothetical protein
MFDAADKTERKLTKSYDLPPDPLIGRENTDHLNLPLVAFCYLLRRLTVRFGRIWGTISDNTTSFAHVTALSVTTS